MWLFRGAASGDELGSTGPAALRLTIPHTHTARPLDKGRPFTVFDIQLEYGARSWSVHHRFSEFKVLSQVLHERYSERVSIPMLPGEHVVAQVLGDDLVTQRRIALEAYLSRVIAVVPLDDDCLSAFLGLETLGASDADAAASADACAPPSALDNGAAARATLPPVQAPPLPQKPQQPQPPPPPPPPLQPHTAGSERVGAGSGRGGETLEPVAEHSPGSGSRDQAAPRVAAGPSRSLSSSDPVKGEPTPFTWELIWQGPIGRHDYYR
jgi:hypothetical protein